MKKHSFISDISFWALLATNIFASILILKSNSGLTNMLWIFWFQSVIIGIFNIRKMMIFENSHSTSNEPNEGLASKFMKHFFSTFFVLHYGSFQLIYFFILIGINEILIEINPTTATPLAPDKTIIFAAAIAFLIYQTFSYFYNRKADIAKYDNIGKIMILPYKRIWVMHLALFGAAFLTQYGTSIIFFLMLKTIADMWSHVSVRK